MKAETHYRIFTMIMKVGKWGMPGKTISAIALLMHQQLVYNVVIKRGRSNWLKMHPQQINPKQPQK